MITQWHIQPCTQDVIFRREFRDTVNVIFIASIGNGSLGFTENCTGLVIMVKAGKQTGNSRGDGGTEQPRFCVVLSKTLATPLPLASSTMHTVVKVEVGNCSRTEISARQIC